MSVALQDELSGHLRSAQAREQEAEDNLRRNSELVAEGAISQRTLVEARAAADAARSEQKLPWQKRLPVPPAKKLMSSEQV